VQDNKITWADFAWLKYTQALPVVPEGILSVEDALMAHKMGLAGVYLSNRGGRQLDGAPAPLQVLLEINKYAPHLTREIPIFADGGMYSTNHALKFLRLGVGLWGWGVRARLYILTVYFTDVQVFRVQFALTMGQAGVEKMIQT
jgi:L-lactate dehydrogenase (cytochrome)